jgi:hypothetical protein
MIPLDPKNVGKKCILHRERHTQGPDGLTIIAMSAKHYLVEGFIGNFHNGAGSELVCGRYGTKRNCWWFSPHDIKSVYEDEKPQERKERTNRLFDIDDI